MQLFPYQIEGAKFLAERGRALLADEMGLGKSAQAIAACASLGAVNIVVVCPASLVANWKREFTKFAKIAPQSAGWGYALRVQSYDSLIRQGLAEHKGLDLRGYEIDVLILDEAHYLKNPKAKRTKAIFGPKCDGAGGLVSQAKNVFCLTGTPTPNNPSELWPMLRAVMPGAIERDAKKPASYWQFVTKYCRTQDTGFGIKIVGGKNLGELKERIAPFVLRRKKDEVLKDLPPIRFDELPLQIEKSDWEPHPGAATSADIALIEDALAEHGAAGLREIAPHVARLRRLTGLAKVGPTVEWIKEQFEGGLKKLVVFAHHTDVVKTLYEMLQPWMLEAGFSSVDTLTGSTSSEYRQAHVDHFQNNPRAGLFIGQIQAAGTGITLTAASDMLFVESSWVPAENEQAAMRIHRIGQRNACVVRFATLAGSIDEQIQRAVMRKTADIAKLFN